MGILVTENGLTPLISGLSGPARNMPQGARGFNIVTRTHVEGHAAAVMQGQGARSGTLFLNNTPCASCDKLLPRMVGEGAEMTVKTPYNYPKTFNGMGN